jgi:NAD+ kinase
VADAPRHLGIVANLRKPDALPVARALQRRLTGAGRRVSLAPNLAAALGEEGGPPGVPHESDLLLVLGGDGTLLSTVRDMKDSTTPVLGINLGGLGFLTAVSSSEIEDCVAAVIGGRFTVEERHLLRATFRGDAGVETVIDALNEVVLDEGTFTRRAIVLEVHVDGVDVGTFTADGLIVATPTGSTAYSLSAGGPIVKPTVPALVMSPVCAHSLSIRPLVFSEDEVVEVQNRIPGVTVKITADGQASYWIQDESPIRIELSPRKARLAFLEGRPYYEILRSKLNWGGIPKDR